MTTPHRQVQMKLRNQHRRPLTQKAWSPHTNKKKKLRLNLTRVKVRSERTRSDTLAPDWSTIQIKGCAFLGWARCRVFLFCLTQSTTFRSKVGVRVRPAELARLTTTQIMFSSTPFTGEFLYRSLHRQIWMPTEISAKPR